MVNVRQNNNSTVNIRVQDSSSQTLSSELRMRDNTDYLAAGLARDWAIRTDAKVENLDYSSKYYAQQAKQSENLAKEYMEETLSAIETRVPVATSNVLGGIKVGSNLSITEDGTLSGLLSAEWGNITGTLAAQTDLQSELNAKSDVNLENINSAGLDKLIQSNALKTGSLSSSSVVLNWVKEMKHSTFDISKFTVVGNPTVTNDGDASGFSDGNYLTCTVNFPAVYNTFDFYLGEVTLTALSQNQWFFISEKNVNSVSSGFIISFDTSGKTRYFLGSGASSWDIANDKTGNLTYSTGDKIKFRLNFNGSSYTLYSSVNNGDWQIDSYTDSSLKILMNQTIYIGSDASQNYLLGSVDLKQFSISVDGAEVFSGNKTGTDSYTINGSTVTIPYTLSKTGSKIVNSVYRTQVASVYNVQGYAPYYTLSDTDFTLPQGEIYGLMNKIKQETPYVVETYINGYSWYRVYSDGWCEQGGQAGTQTTGAATITLLKPYVDTAYTRLVTIGNRADYSTWAIYPGNRTTTSFDVWSPVTGYELGFDWETRGYIR